MEQEETRTLEARRQLIWKARREGYQDAIDDLMEIGETDVVQNLLYWRKLKENARVS